MGNFCMHYTADGRGPEESIAIDDPTGSLVFATAREHGARGVEIWRDKERLCRLSRSEEHRDLWYIGALDPSPGDDPCGDIDDTTICADRP